MAIAEPGPRARRGPAAGDGTLRVALVGAGYVARFHRDALATLPRTTVVAVSDPDRGRAAALAAACGAAVCSLEELPAHGVDLAHVLVPPDQHAAVARRILESGIGVLVEKPLAVGSAEARGLATLARARDLPLGVNHNLVHDPAIVRLLDHVARGSLGRVAHVQATLAAALPQLATGDHAHWMFRQPQNVLLEQAVHFCAVLHALLGRVRGATTTLLRSRRLLTGATFHERWSVALRAERGTAELHLAFGGELPRSIVRVLGTDGATEADLLRSTLVSESATRWPDALDAFLAGWRRGGQLRRDARRVFLAYARYTLGRGRRADPYFVGMRDSIASFHRRLRAGEAPNDGEAAAEVLDWCEAIWAGAGPQKVSISTPLPQPRPARAGEVALLGGAGLIGRRLAARLLARDVPVTITGRRAAVPAALQEGAAAGALRALPMRLDDAAGVARAVDGARVVVHLATGAGESWEEVRRAMVDGSVAAAEAALAAGVETFVYVSSIAALDPRAGGRGEIRDDHPLDARPLARDVYSRGKIAAEQALRALAARGLPLVIVRPGVVLAPEAPLQHPGLGFWVRDDRCIGWGRGDHPLPLVSADDVAEAIARIVVPDGRARDQSAMHGRAVNLCARVPLSASEVVAAMRRRTGRDLRFYPRPLWRSQLLELGKWAIKRIGGRRVPLPAYRDLLARALRRPFASETARTLLGWQPVEQLEAFLRAALPDDGDAGD